MTIPSSKGERTSQAILEAAYLLFLEHGFHATSMRQIAQRAGLALGGIYNHFESKEQIFETVLLEKHPYRQVMQIIQDTPGETMEHLAQNAASTMMAELGKRPGFIKLGFIELSEFKGKHISTIFQIIYPEIYPLFQRIQEQESDLRDIPLQIIFLSFLGTFFSYFMITNLVIPTGGIDPEEVALEQFIDIFLHGVLNPHLPQPEIPIYPSETQGSEHL
jgi:AcrR family transcriptional regulator